jgi:hypothetical protein
VAGHGTRTDVGDEPRRRHPWPQALVLDHGLSKEASTQRRIGAPWTTTPRSHRRRRRPSTSCVGTSHGSGDCCKRAPTSTPTPDATNALFAARVEQHIADYDHHRVEYARRVVGGT